MLQQNTYQVFEQYGWFDRLGVERHDIGMFMGAEECRTFNLRINLPALRLYRTDVEQRTRLTVDALRDQDLDE